MNLHLLPANALRITFTFCICLLSSASPGLAQAESPGQTPPLALENKRVMVLGDSITNGGMYVSYIEYYLQKHYPDKKYDIISVGLSSETTSGLSENDHPFPRPCVHERLERALDKIKPDVVSACYGMNDGIYHPQSPARMEAFKQGIYKLVRTCQAKGVEQVILNTPPPFDPQPVEQKLYGEGASDYSYKHPYFRYAVVLEDYTDWIMRLSIAGVRSVDFNTPLADYLNMKREHDKAFRFSGDGIHPSNMGHLLMAQVFLQGIGERIQFAELETEFQTVHDDPLFKLVDQRRKLRSKGWLEYVGYTRGKTVQRESIEDIRAQAADLQAKIEMLRN